MIRGLGPGDHDRVRAATIARIEPFLVVEHAIAWTGFILFADANRLPRRGDSWLHSAPREFAWLALASIPLWVMFEGFNARDPQLALCRLPENPALRYFAMPGRSRPSGPRCSSARS
jgi:hypothetical protein